MITASLFYRHQDLAPIARTTNRDIERVAAAFRKQLSAEDRVALNLEDLRKVEALNVNGVHFEVWSDLTRPLFDTSGVKVPGIFEFLPEIEYDAVNVRVSPADERFTHETVLSTFAHELGHAVFEGPFLINERRTNYRFGEPVEAYRVTEFEGARPEARLSDAVIRSEWRANQFMGCLLVPREQLFQTIEDIAQRHQFVLDFDDVVLEGPGAGEPRIVCQSSDFDGHLYDLIGHLGLIFGVSPYFVNTRMKRYGLIDESTSIY